MKQIEYNSIGGQVHGLIDMAIGTLKTTIIYGIKVWWHFLICQMVNYNDLVRLKSILIFEGKTNWKSFELASSRPTL
jgi:hypothetical protein